MAFIVSRPGGRWEIRESYSTQAGPRARTLANFRTLSATVIDQATRRAKIPFDSGTIIAAAKRAGVPLEMPPGDEAATELLRELAHGANVRPGLRELLVRQLGGTDTGRVDDSLVPWIGASYRERADALIDLLSLSDRLPKSRKTQLQFPRLSPRPAVPR